MIKLFVMDVDGTMTDGALHIDNTGKELFKSFHARDGYGIKYLLSNTKSAIITGRTSDIVSHRAEELGISRLVDSCLLFIFFEPRSLFSMTFEWLVILCNTT